MGLDMYLSARKYISGWESSYARNEEAAKAGRKEVELFDSVIGAIGLERDDISVEMPAMNISIEVAYWRKANAIHNWFIENVAYENIDNCEPMRVEREQLSDLVEVLGEIVALGDAPDRMEKANEILPTEGGFFFGSTEYDEYYWESILWSYKKLKGIIDNPKFDGFDFQYQASW